MLVCVCCVEFLLFEFVCLYILFELGYLVLFMVDLLVCLLVVDFG